MHSSTGCGNSVLLSGFGALNCLTIHIDCCFQPSIPFVLGGEVHEAPFACFELFHPRDGDNMLFGAARFVLDGDRS